MGSFCEENGIIPKKDVPVPPPFPMMMMAPKAVFRRTRWCCMSNPTTQSWDRLFDDAYRADVSVQTSSTDDTIYAHSNVLGLASPVFRNMFRRQSRNKRGLFIVPIRGVPAEAVRVFLRFLYSSCYEEDQMEQHVLSLLVLSHSYVVPRLKRECEDQLEHKYLNVDNAIDVFQLALLCDAPRLSNICHRLILNNFKAVSSCDGWKAMKESHPILEKELLATVADEANRQKEKAKKAEERKIYLQLYEAMEALVHICRDGCRTIGPHDKVLNEHQDPCSYEACKGLESLIRHFAGCKLRVPGGCVHCKRMWQLLELHSRLCVDSNVCRVPLCKYGSMSFHPSICRCNCTKKTQNSPENSLTIKITSLTTPKGLSPNNQEVEGTSPIIDKCVTNCRNFKDKTGRQKKKDDIMWRILVRKILRTKSITGAPYFSLAASS